MNTATRHSLDRLTAQHFPSTADLQNAMPPTEPIWEEHPHAQLAQPAPECTHSRRTLFVAVAMSAAAVVASAVAVPLLSSTPAAATPPTLDFHASATNADPSTVLAGLADKAAQQPPVLPLGDRYEYVQSRTWTLRTSQNADGELLGSRIVATEREQWFNREGTGRILATEDGQLTMYSGPITPANLGAGTPPPAFIQGQDQTAIADQLKDRHPQFDAAQWILFIRDTWNLQAVPPAVQAALLDVLADTPGIDLDGTTTDRADRPGIAVSATGTLNGQPRSRYILVLSTATGASLDFERVALAPGRVKLDLPATTQYVVWLKSGIVGSTDERP